MNDKTEKTPKDAGPSRDKASRDKASRDKASRDKASRDKASRDKAYGMLVPLGGGDPIPLLKKRLRIGRREGCDIILNFANISGHHALMEIDEGYWFIKDLRSRNGIKVDGKRILQGLKKRVDPGVTLSIAKHQYEVAYDPSDLGAYGTPPQDEQLDNLFSQSLLERAGLKRKKAND